MQAGRLRTAQAKEEITEKRVSQHPGERRGEHDRGVTDKGDGDLTWTRMLHLPRLGPVWGGYQLSGGRAQKT